MATAEPSDNKVHDKSFILCSVCQEALKHPQVLQCLHHLCADCITTVKCTQEGQDDSFLCPVCQKLTPRTSIRPNPIMEQLVAVISEFSKANIPSTEENIDKFCIQCNRSDVKSYCMDCKVDLCDNCSTTHLRLPTCSDHNIVATPEAETISDTSIVKNCPDHANQPTDMYCTQCEKVICSQCQVEKHNDHETEKKEAAMERKVSEVKGQLKSLTSENEKLIQQKQSVISTLTQVQKNMSTITRQVVHNKENKEARLDKDCGHVTQILKHHEQGIQMESSLLEGHFNNLISSVGPVLSWASMLLDNAENPTSLYELQHKVIQKINSLLAESKIPQNMETFMDKATIKASFMPTDLQCRNMVGEVIFGHIKENDRTVSEDATQSSEVNENKITDNALAAGDRSVDVKSTPSVPTPSAQLDIVNVVSYRLADVNLNDLTTSLEKRSKKKYKKIKLKNNFSSFCYFQNKLWFPGETSIVVYSKSGDLVKTLKYTGIASPTALHPFTSTKMLVAADNGLHLMDLKTGNSIVHILQGVFCDVHANGDLIVALETGKGHDKIHILQATDPPTHLSSFPLDHAYVKRVLLHNQSIYLGECGLGHSAISVYTLHGEKMQQYGTWGNKAAGEINWPYLCTIDSHGNMLIVDHGNQCLQLLNQSGQFTVIKLADMKWCRDLHIVEDNLYILYGYADTYIQIQSLKI